MPGWHEKLKPHVENDEVVQLGLIQEQHPDRCKLFMQWKGMDWPVMVDSLNLLGVKVVPITLFIDEHGVIRNTRPKAGDLDKFLATGYPAPKRAVPKVDKPNIDEVEKTLKQAQGWKPSAENVDQLKTAGDMSFLWSIHEDAAGIAAQFYWSVLKLNKDDGEVEFRAGVASRQYFDEGLADASAFEGAVEHWERSLELDPNHYIRRRRIQQYGPRLDKPYSFYDWVNTAREEITERGDTPVELIAEPGGAEFAHPDKSFETEEGAENPDPDAKIKLDKAGLIEVQSVPVPGTIKAGQASRVHVTFQVNPELKAHWNNEAGEAVVWVNAPDGWSVEKRLWTLENGEGATSDQDRKLEFEVRAPKDAEPGDYTLDCFALYYICEDVDGVCQYLRQDYEVQVAIK